MYTKSIIKTSTDLDTKFDVFFMFVLQKQWEYQCANDKKEQNTDPDDDC